MSLIDKIIEWVEENKEDIERSDNSYDVMIYYHKIMDFLNKLKFLENKLGNLKSEIMFLLIELKDNDIDVSEFFENNFDIVEQGYIDEPPIIDAYYHYVLKIDNEDQVQEIIKKINLLIDNEENRLLKYSISNKMNSPYYY